MKTSKFLLPLAIITFSLPTASYAQSAGDLTYCLPSTTLRFEVEAVREYHVPGPYAKYAQKYLGADAPEKETGTCYLTDIKVHRYTEADMTARYTVNFGSRQSASEKFLKMTSQGIVAFADAGDGWEEYWRFPTPSDRNPAGEDILTSNLTSDETVLYKSVRNQEGTYDKVAVRQSQVVEKSPEKKAQEAAEMIFKLRQKRIDIITGDTDATFSGEAMQAVIDEITRMEAEYTKLFLGTVYTSTERAVFDVVPKASEEFYVVFRISDSEGLVSNDVMSGRPVTLQLTPDGPAASPAPQGKATGIHYRIPAICTLRLIDGQETLMNSRIPVYQKGETLLMPL